jgi:S1-C subfamily serine protease
VVAERVRPAILRLEVVGSSGSGSGSGVLFRDTGHVLTNSHVVRDAQTVTAIMANGRQWPAVVLGSDPITDVAVLKLDGPPPFPAARLGTTVGLKVGQPAVAIGSPLGLAGGPSVSTGVISALGRRVESASHHTLFDMIQSDAPIAPGSSGGALLDAGGDVVGITTALAIGQSGAEGLSFAVPIDVARDVAEQIIASGRAAHPWLGISGADLDAAAATELGVQGGAVVQEVVPGSPAEVAGLQASDVIIHLGASPVAGISELVVALRSLEPGDEVTVTWLRGRERLGRAVTLVERPPA